MSDVVIIGASHAGAEAAVALRKLGHEGRVTLVGEEAHPPYHRPPLSKDYLSGAKTLDAILLRPEASYAEADIDLRLGVRAERIDREGKRVELSDGSALPYGKLIVATGARVRRLSIPGAELPGVFYLRDARDVEAIRDRVAEGGRAVIVGGGYIGLETAASLRKRGMEVTLLEAMDRILARVTAPVMSDFYRRIHTEEGVVIHEGCMASEIEQGDGELIVTTKCGKRVPADMVVIGIGVIPNMELAEEAGLSVGNGIEVDAHCRTSDPDIYAVGDVSWHENPLYARHLRLESVPNATEQAKVAAQSIVGAPKPYAALPWFWSDQFDLKLQIAGLSEGHDDIVVRGNVEGRSVAAYYFAGGRLLAVDAVNAPRDFMTGKMALSKGMTLDKAGLREADADLKGLMRPL